MENFDFGLDDNSGTRDQKQTNSQQSRFLPILRCMKYLVHACQCRDESCRLPGCQKMSTVLQHVRSCKENTNGRCPICKQFIALCGFHAKHCQETKCPIPFCGNIKNKFKARQLQRQAQIPSRHIATVQNCGMSSAALLQSSINANSAAAKTKLIAPKQQAQVVGVPVSMLNMGNVTSWENSGYPQNQQPHQNTQPLPNPQQGLLHPLPNPQQSLLQPLPNAQLGLLQPFQIVGGSNFIPNSTVNLAMVPPQPMPNPGSSTALWQQLQTLTPPSVQQQQVLSLIRTNTQLMNSFIRQQTQQQQHQQHV